MSKMVFKRIEKKYMLTEFQFKQLMRSLDKKMEPDRFPTSLICNIYFDTPNYELIRRSIDKPIYKEKLRLRSYGVPSGDSPVFAEIKKKFKGVVYKRRAEMDYKNAWAYLRGRDNNIGQSQITKEIDWMLQSYGQLVPAMYLSYERLSFVGSDDSSLRITFDNNITYRNTELQLTKGVWGMGLLPDNKRLMEVKFSGGMPIWLVEELDRLKIYPTSFSKYGSAYQNVLLSEKQKTGGVICA